MVVYDMVKRRPNSPVYLLDSVTIAGLDLIFVCLDKKCISIYSYRGSKRIIDILDMLQKL